MKHLEELQLVKMYAKYNYKCFVCGKPAIERAHIIGQGKTCHKMYGNTIIDNPLNWLPVCSIHCNSLVDVGKGNLLASEIVDKIIRGDEPGILVLVRANIYRKRGK